MLLLDRPRYVAFAYRPTARSYSSGLTEDNLRDFTENRHTV